MNWEAIKYIYRSVLIYNYKFEYLGEDRYKLANYYSSGEKRWEAGYKNGQLHGKHIGWNKNGQKMWEQKYQNGKEIK